MSLTYLKVKILSLADESRTIRCEELTLINAGKGASPDREGLYLHRINEVRPESRAALLAYGYLRGTPYRAMENAATKSKPDWKRVASLIKKYGEEFDPKAFEDWQAAVHTIISRRHLRETFVSDTP
jgi:hypothetical protein